MWYKRVGGVLYENRDWRKFDVNYFYDNTYRRCLLWGDSMRHNSYRLNAVIIDIDSILDGRTHTWLYKKLGMKRSTYYWKKENGFKPEED